MKPPSHNETEMALIGCLLQDSKIITDVQAEGGVNLFYATGNANIYTAILNNKGADAVTVAAALRDSSIAEYLSKCLMQAPSPLMAGRYIETLKDLYIKREFLKVMQNGIYYVDTPDILTTVEQQLREVVKKISKAKFTDYVDAVDSLWFDYVQNEGTEPDYMKTGIADLDRLIDGIEHTEHIIVAGRPSMGKTALATDIVRAVAKQGFKVNFHTMEMSEKALTRRFVCAEANISLKAFRNRRLTANQKAHAAGVSSMIARGKLNIFDGRVTVSEIKAEALKTEPDLIVVDYLQLMSLDRRAGMTTNDLVGDNATGLQAIAKSGPAVVTISQLSRASEKEKRRPGLADLYESGKIEAVGDKIIMPYREDKESEEAEILVVKQKDGPIGAVDVKFMREAATFRGLEIHREPPDVMAGGKVWGN